MNLGSALKGNGNELQSVKLQSLASAPSGATAAWIYYDTALAGGFIRVGSTWRPMDAALLTDGSIQNSALATNPLARANHTGSQAASTISDLATVVKAYTLDAFATPVGNVSFGGFRATSVGNAVGAQDAVPLSQVNTLIAQGVAGISSIKAPVKALATTNLILSGTQTVDGVALVAGDFCAATAQTTATQNNIYIVAAGAWTLRGDSNSTGAWLEGTEFLVNEGTANAGTIWRQVTAGTITVGTTAMSFLQTAKPNTYSADNVTLSTSGTIFSAKLGFGITADGNGLAVDKTKVALKATGTFTGDGTTTVFTATHNFGTKLIGSVSLWDSGGNLWLVDVNTATTNTVTFTFNSVSVPANASTWSWVILA